MEEGNNIESGKSRSKYEYSINCIMRWIIFGVLIVVAPPLCNVLFRIVVRLKVDFVEYIPDILLAVLSVCCNLLNTCVDREKRMAYLLRWIIGVVLGMISLACWGLFFAIRFNNDFITKDAFGIWAERIFYMASGIIIVCTLIGIGIEIYTWRCSKKRD